MIPSVLATQLKQGLKDYIGTTFPISTPGFQGCVQRFLDMPDMVFHAPYVSVRLPFRVAEAGQDRFPAVHQPFKPFVHQQRAFDRLSGDDSVSTLVATGTGSGKTECFLYPILDYCWRHRGEPGIKALIIYPMNALAADQARRIARLIYENSEVRGNVTAGMYVGGREADASKVMGAESIITDRDMLRQSPPDILLTNYKMLDYLLIRPQDALLWQNNRPDSLKYIVVDELHTFDGAQGTDLACLLRRLKSRLFTPKGYVCCVGTSATMGGGDYAGVLLVYASKVFGELFDESAVITEDRLTAEEFLQGVAKEYNRLPDPEQAERLHNLTSSGDEMEYLCTAYLSWFGDDVSAAELTNDGWRINLAGKLIRHAFFHNLMTVIEKGNAQYTYIIEHLGNRYPALRESGENYAAAVLDGLLALVSHARFEGPDDEHPTRPFLQVQVQVWLRELRRMLARVESGEINLALADDLNDEQKKQYLPVINCRDCGATGWVSLLNENMSLALPDLRVFYNAFFRQDKKVVMLFPCRDNESNPHLHTGIMLCPKCLHVNTGHDTTRCRSCGNAGLIRAWLPQLEASRESGYYCPFCGSSGGLSLIGSRSATLISVGVSQIYASRFNDDKKLLAFSDNVQDASHRAGFFNARTWRFNLRSAMQKFVQDSGNGMPLGEFATEFVNYWWEHMTREEFAAAFIAPNLTWRKPYEEMLATGVLAGDANANSLLADIRNRLELEVFLEYGISARIGRSLEKSGASVIKLNRSKFDQAVERAYARVTNEIGELHDLDIKIIAGIMKGMLTKLKNNGGFYRKVYENFIKENGKTYQLSNKLIRWMPGMTRGRNVPRFLAGRHTHGKGRDPFDVPDHRSWYGRWTEKALEYPLLREDIPTEVNSILIEELRNAGMLIQSQTKKGIPVWSISTDAYSVTGSVAQMVCDQCGHSLSISQNDADLMTSIPCQRNDCAGQYMISDKKGLDFYGKLYSNGDLVRINAEEHTGLLDRDHREEVEKKFKSNKAEHKSWYPNLLSCTPTLEMGIDIGDLSTVVLCNIPPSQSQYLQRIGRAGRQDGNAMTVAVVNARPHDLYFFEDPSEMLDGVVQPPDVFLNASAVLERQFVAYCFDCWVKGGIADAAIPKSLGQCLSILKTKPADRFPFNFLHYIRNNLSWLNRSFMMLFDDQLAADTREQMRIFSCGQGVLDSPLDCRIVDAFEAVSKQREVLRKDIVRLGKRIRELEGKPKDSSFEKDMMSLRLERGALRGLVSSIDGKDIFNFFSDEGLLPNYAFPEAGIILKTIIYRKLNIEGEYDVGDEKARKYEHYIYEYNRPAASAIREFAPQNSFYAGGRKIAIDQVDIKSSKVEPWRLCPSCSHAQLEVSGKDVASCPRCGSPAWADQGQVRQMLKVRMVYSNMEYSGSRSGDESDDRDVVFYCNEMLVDVDESKDIVSAYKIDDEASPFGFEFVRKATIREINFGEIDITGTKLTVAGKEDVRKGFLICHLCGKVQKDNSKDEPQHTRMCQARDNGKDANFEEYLYLYREFTSEAIRILIPATTFDASNTRRETFIASIMLGLELYFGSVDHLRVCICQEPVPDADYRKNYLVLYDTVPGGTGYLKQLMTSEKPMMEIFEKALEAVKACTCGANPLKDGCYRCLYAYKQSQQIGQISRKAAMEMLSDIINGKDSLVKIPSINSIPVNSLFESELERRFIEALAQSGTENRPVEISKQLVNMKEGYYFSIGDMSWKIEPQFELGPAQGIPVLSKADFVFWPSRDNMGVKPVAVFTDGYAFHKDIAHLDSLKRMAIAKNGKFRVWSLSWKDVQNAFYPQGDYFRKTLSTNDMPYGVAYHKTIEANGVNDFIPGKMNSFEMLLKYLSNGTSDDRFLKQAFAHSMCLCEPNKLNDEDAYLEWFSSVSELMQQFGFNMSSYGQNCFFGTWQPLGNACNITIYTALSQDDLKARKIDGAFVVIILEDRQNNRSNAYEVDWNGFFYTYNLLQFMPDSLIITRKGIDDDIYSILGMMFEETTVIEAADWTETLGLLIEESMRALAQSMAEKGLPAPTTVGYELSDENAGVLGQAELVWETRQIAVLSDEQAEFKEVFEINGWQVALSCDPDAVFLLFNGQEGINNG